MAEGIFVGALVGELVSRVGRLVDNLVTWKEEHAKLQGTIARLNKLVNQQLEFQQDLNGECSEELQQLIEVVADLEDWVHYASAIASRKRKWWRWPQKLYARHVCATKLREAHQKLKDGLADFAVAKLLQPAVRQGADQALWAYKQQMHTAARLQRTLSDGRDSDSVQRAVYKVLGDADVAAASGADPAETSGACMAAPCTDNHLYSLEAHIANVVKALTSDGEQHLMGIVGSAKKWNLEKETAPAVVPESGRVGVEGMGGIGKTTLAIKVFQHKDVESHFGRGNLFWLTISQTLDEVGVLQALWAQVFGSSNGFPSRKDSERVNLSATEERRDICLRAREKLGWEMKKKGRVLLVLDDVWMKEHAEQFEVLVRNAEECKVLVTTRDSELLDSLHWQRYSLNLLDEDTSVKLFCRHAFGTESPPRDLEAVVREACQECKGLPLALRVIGASFRNVSGLEAWQSQLTKMQNSVAPNEDAKIELYERLRLSVDHLPFPILKELFVDFAAYPEDYAMSVRHLVDNWAADPRIGSNQRAVIFLSILLSRSLVEFSETAGRSSSPYEGSLGFCKVHDLLRDVAVQLANEQGDRLRRKQLFFVGEGSFDPGAGEYRAVKMAFHSYKDSGGKKFDLYQLQKSLEAPELQVLVMRKLDWVVAEDTTCMGKWQFPVCVGGHQFQRGFAHCHSLRVLEYDNGPDDSGPCRVDTESLRVLRCMDKESLVGDAVSSAWLGHHRRLEVLEVECHRSHSIPTASLQSMRRLRAVSIEADRAGSWIPRLSHFSWLEELHCRSHSEFEHKDLTCLESLVSLRVLNLSQCASLGDLPANLRTLKKLMEINISGTRIKTLPWFLGDLPVLESITASKCPGIDVTALEQDGKFGSVRRLDLSDCRPPSFPTLSENAMRTLQQVVWKGNGNLPHSLSRRQQSGLHIICG